MLNRYLLFLTTCCVVLPAAKAGAQSTPAAPVAAATAAKTAPRITANPAPAADTHMAWWREARFGMFIHWGVYSVPAGRYEDKEVPGLGEWIMHDARIPRATYQAYAKEFNPVNYDPDAWVRLAKEAGVKYIVITSKHHDGFAMFETDASKWNIVDATPYGKDVLKPLAEACRKYGMKLGFYYSQANDWNNPGGAAAGGHWDSTQNGSMDDYIRNVAVPQVREILTQYGDVAELWWDVPSDMTPERAAQFTPLLALQPGIVVNNRLGGGVRGDIETPEQYIPATGIPGRDWETCMTMNDTWGYKTDDNHWKSVETLIRNLVDIASKGGNYLLNVGPTSLGEFPQPIIDRLQAIGRWMSVNGEAIYGTQASPFERLDWGRCTRKGDVLYLHVFHWPADGRLLVPGLHNPALSASLLSGGAVLSTHKTADGLVIDVPAAAPDTIATVIKLRIKGSLNVTVPPPKPITAANGVFTLHADQASLKAAPGAQPPQLEGNPQNIGFWTDEKGYITWLLRFDRPGTYTITADVATPAAAAAFSIALGGVAALDAQVTRTGSYTLYQVQSLGRLTVSKAGTYTLSVTPRASAWRPVNLRSLALAPAP
ncbi:MAG TPA: alpha-L-fucosidase [Dinghuibacter sp.]|jgi:alpha-L-fucosidase|uniref:alpha-L-fucosidase n=1 Tax=Dinghuibacter sp. TaxID=2024697 RepID=UPI002BF282D6|nr:alpha-L-fucosidase [Dinghuibacter sp.]HTJ11043.1 alpha-L-fucosidase [Dinghuibacter sp.]